MEHQKEIDEPSHMGGGDPLLLRIVMTILMPVFWILDKLKHGYKS
ncbi:MAG: hypothetical protein PHI47_03470 [Sulfuricurvum sp.]|nr:hypothetical protein [Sulfuricurvum sp.]MDD5159086.1 hypothetical protein [Sulfuricurvum sp.]